MLEMETLEDYKKRVDKYSIDELRDILLHIDKDKHPDRAEYINQKILSFKIDTVFKKEINLPYYTVPTLRFICLSVITFGISLVYWSYKNWQVTKENNNEDISPFWRAIFINIFIFSMASRIKDELMFKEIKCKYNPIVLGISNLLINVLYELPSFFKLLGTFTFVPSLLLQRYLIKLNISNKFDKYTCNKLDWWQKVLIAIVYLFYFIAIVGIFIESNK